jgi:hypothetical protein
MTGRAGLVLFARNVIMVLLDFAVSHGISSKATHDYAARSQHAHTAAASPHFRSRLGHKLARTIPPPPIAKRILPDL